MSDQSSGEEDRPLVNAPLVHPGGMLPLIISLSTGWTEWYRYKTSRYREVVVSRRRNPLAFFGPVGVFHGVFYLFVWLLPWWDAPTPLDVLRNGIGAETVLGVVPIVSIALVGAWAVAGIVVRRRTREEQQFDRDRMYPPAEYWREVDDAE